MSVPSGNPSTSKAPKEFILEVEDVQLIKSLLQAADPQHFLQIGKLRWLLTYHRIQRLKDEDFRIFEKLDPGVANNTIPHNLKNLKKGIALARCDFLIRALTAIDRVTEGGENKKILCVGPRSESEILALLGSEFRLENISALDLISYSPLVDLGDMHDMPYADKSFDIIILGWVLGYSKDPAKVAREVMRVAKKNAVVAIGNERNPMTQEQLALMGEILDDCTRFENTDEILRDYGDNIRCVYFKHDVPPDQYHRTVNLMTIFELK